MVQQTRIMFSLVADYGTSDEDESSSSGSSNSGDESNCEEKKTDNTTQRYMQTRLELVSSMWRCRFCSSSTASTLPSASLMLANEKKSIPGGVFSNPFKEAEDAKMASLEKHVKMVMLFVKFHQPGMADPP